MLQENLQTLIEAAFEERTQLSSKNVSSEIKNAVETVIDKLDKGDLRVAEKIDGTWVTHQWIKKAILLSFKIHDTCFIARPEASVVPGNLLEIQVIRLCQDLLNQKLQG